MQVLYICSYLFLHKTLIIQTKNTPFLLEVNLKEETVWLTQAQMEELFDVKHATISEHISNIFKEGELEEKKSKNGVIFRQST